MYSVKQCGVKLKPPSLVVTYVENPSNKMRCRTMPVRNFKETSKVSDFAEEMKNNQRHRTLLKDVSLVHIEKMLHILQGHLKGKSLSDAVEYAKEQVTVDPNKDLNKLDEQEVGKAKRIMDGTFESNRIKPDDEDFQYDVQVNFDEVEPVEASGWDTESDNDEF